MTNLEREAREARGERERGREREREARGRHPQHIQRAEEGVGDRQGGGQVTASGERARKEERRPSPKP